MLLKIRSYIIKWNVLQNVLWLKITNYYANASWFSILKFWQFPHNKEGILRSHSQVFASLLFVYFSVPYFQCAVLHNFWYIWIKKIMFTYRWPSSCRKWTTNLVAMHGSHATKSSLCLWLCIWLGARVVDRRNPLTHQVITAKY